jgi:hypothetical protein
MAGTTTVKRANTLLEIRRAVKWDIAIRVATKMLEATPDGSPISGLGSSNREEHGSGDRLRRQQGARRPHPATSSKQASAFGHGTKALQAPGSTDKNLAKPVTKVGVIRSGSHGQPVRAALRAPAQECP